MDRGRSDPHPRRGRNAKWRMAGSGFLASARNERASGSPLRGRKWVKVPLGKISCDGRCGITILAPPILRSDMPHRGRRWTLTLETAPGDERWLDSRGVALDMPNAYRRHQRQLAAAVPGSAVAGHKCPEESTGNDITRVGVDMIGQAGSVQVSVAVHPVKLALPDHHEGGPTLE
jgi:hypothetical protein